MAEEGNTLQQWLAKLFNQPVAAQPANPPLPDTAADTATNNRIQTQRRWDEQVKKNREALQLRRGAPPKRN